MEIEYVSAPLDIDFLEGAAAAAAPGGDADMPQAGGLGLGAQPAAGAEGGEQPPAEPAAELQRILQRFGTVEELLGTAPARGEDEDEGGAGAGGAGDLPALQQRLWPAAVAGTPAERQRLGRQPVAHFGNHFPA